MAEVDRDNQPVRCRASDYPAGAEIGDHSHAKHQLIHPVHGRLAGGEKVVDIALALGYESPSAFATMFKRQFGQTPSQFFDDRSGDRSRAPGR